ncbi:hypothetical protein KUTeg_013791 [Tegillarca granosa]|uniref:Uncharacterized protein n=1 Tax=Tegillarca granosa TaxID=220873 RepID=A0ABQ9EUQ5_TEGGR|nr:hypothetical protein KUTeg_013791 [Tegillarca granosa]
MNVKLRFEDKDVRYWYKGYVISKVPGFMTWYNLKFEKDRAIYTYELEKDYSRGDLEILIAVDSDENDIDNACVDQSDRNEVEILKL